MAGSCAIVRQLVREMSKVIENNFHKYYKVDIDYAAVHSSARIILCN